MQRHFCTTTQIFVIFLAFPNINKKFELMLTRRAKAYSSSCSVV